MYFFGHFCCRFVVFVLFSFCVLSLSHFQNLSPNLRTKVNYDYPFKVLVI